MAVSVQMPKQGNTVEECLLVEWRVKEGDAVKTGDILCAIETDKASFDVESTADGVVLKLLANAGDLVPVLTDIVVIGEAGESVAAATAGSATAPVETASAPAAAAPAQSATPE
ncbi:MAG: biotin/lipoyl-binding protein, partial [Planctomycetes bacterium]|nr:biotin/lipoyl-binding protein [Planctomycetota bacterium]